MRIVGGENRGLRLAEVGAGDPAAHLRPTADRVREALSRGAAHCTFVDDARAATRLIRDNIARTRRAAQTTLLTCDARRLPPNPGPPATLVFLDPPYGRGLGAPALTAARAAGWIAPGALVVCEEAAPMAAPEGFTRLEDRRYGDTVLTLLATDPPA